jgi:hypothetical protein
MLKLTKLLLLLVLLIPINCSSKNYGESILKSGKYEIFLNYKDDLAKFTITSNGKSIQIFESEKGTSLSETRKMNVFKKSKVLNNGHDQIIYSYNLFPASSQHVEISLFDLDETRTDMMINPKCGDETFTEDVLIQDIDGDGNGEFLVVWKPFQHCSEKIGNGRPSGYLIYKYDFSTKKYVFNGKLFKGYILKNSDKWLSKIKSGDMFYILYAMVSYWSVCEKSEGVKIFDKYYKGPDKAEVKKEILGALNNNGCLLCN